MKIKLCSTKEKTIPHIFFRPIKIAVSNARISKETTLRSIYLYRCDYCVI